MHIDEPGQDKAVSQIHDLRPRQAVAINIPILDGLDHTIAHHDGLLRHGGFTRNCQQGTCMNDQHITFLSRCQRGNTHYERR